MSELGIATWLTGLNPGVLEVVRHAGFDRRLGPQRMPDNAREAITRYQAQNPAAGDGGVR